MSPELLSIIWAGSAANLGVCIFNVLIAIAAAARIFGRGHPRAFGIALAAGDVLVWLGGFGLIRWIAP